MSNITTTNHTNPSLLSLMAEQYNLEANKLHQVLKQTAFAKCRTDEEFMAMCVVANQYGLNPLTKEIYAFPNKDGAVIPVVGIDGWSRIINEHPMFDGLEFAEDRESCTAIIYRKDRSHPVKVTEWMAECQGTTGPWKTHPRRMLRHRALIQAARLAFGFAGIYDKEEAETEQSHSEKVVTHGMSLLSKVQTIANPEQQQIGSTADEIIDVDSEVMTEEISKDENEG